MFDNEDFSMVRDGLDSVSEATREVSRDLQEATRYLRRIAVALEEIAGRV